MKQKYNSHNYKETNTKEFNQKRNKVLEHLYKKEVFNQYDSQQSNPEHKI